MAPQVGLEPTTLRLTAGCSAIELLRSVVGAREARTAAIGFHHNILAWRLKTALTVASPLSDTLLG